MKYLLKCRDHKSGFALFTWRSDSVGLKTTSGISQVKSGIVSGASQVKSVIGPVHRGQGEMEEAGQSRLVGGSCNKQGHLLFLGSHRTVTSSHLPTRI